MTLVLFALSLAGTPAAQPPPDPAAAPADTPLTTRADALRTIREYTGLPEDLRLALSDALQDPVGMNMAVITDAALARGWMPTGFEQRDGFRIYRYKAFK